MKKLIMIAALAIGALAFGGIDGTAVRCTVPKEYTASDKGIFRYRWHAPAKLEPGKRYPLVIFMHGAGEAGEDNYKQLKIGVGPIIRNFQARGEEFFLIAGHANSRWSNQALRQPEVHATAQPSVMMMHQMELVDKLMKALPIDRKRVYVTGLSMGGHGTWDYLVRRPTLFAAAMPVCGSGDPSHAPKWKGTAFWIHHGGRDPVVPVAHARRMNDTLRRLGYEVRYSEYRGVKHNSWNRAYGDQGAMNWVFTRVRK